MAVWLCGRVDARLCGCAAVRLCGCVAVWLWLSFRVCVQTEVQLWLYFQLSSCEVKCCWRRRPGLTEPKAMKRSKTSEPSATGINRDTPNQNLPGDVPNRGSGYDQMLQALERRRLNIRLEWLPRIRPVWGGALGA